MGITDVFTNADVPAADQDIKSPAFSVTKVGTLLAGVILAVLGVFPQAMRQNTTLDVAAVAAGTLVVLGVISLWAVDIVTRQRAAEARLRYGANGGGDGDGNGNGATPEHFFAIPDVDDLRLQIGPGADEYKIYVVEVEGEQVRLHAQRDGESVRKSFTRPS